MSMVVRRLALMVLVALPLALPTLASAQTREFSGKVGKITGRQIIVDNRMGDKLKFKKLESTTVEGEKTAWGDVKKGDWVAVEWKMMDNPRKAYRVKVLPPKEDE